MSRLRDQRTARSRLLTKRLWSYFLALTTRCLKTLEKIFELPVTFSGCKRLEKLDVSSNQIQYCDVLKEMGFLKVLNLKTNSIEEFPDADLEELIKLDISKNKLSAFPSNLKAMKSLKKLQMAHNQINVIPSELGNGQLLEELDLSWNNLGQVLPRSLVIK